MEKEKDRNQGELPDPGNEEEPQVYNVEKGVGGWVFSRRELLAAAATTAAAAAAAAVAAKRGKPDTVGSAGFAGVQVPITLELATVAMIAVNPAQSFTRLWRFANRSEGGWAGGAKLYLPDAGQFHAPALLPVPEIASGQTADVQMEMVAPVTPGTYRSHWRLQIAQNDELVASGPFVVINGCIVESLHPYENNTTRGWMVTNPDEHALRTRVHFSQVDVQPGDYIILKDEVGTELQRITGSFPSGVWSNAIPGRIVNLELVTDPSGIGWGFCLDQVETIHLVYLPIVRREPTPTPEPCLAESPHPYNNNMAQTYVITNPNPSAQGSRVHFSRIELENNYDYLIVRDSSGWEYERITGSYPAGRWSAAVLGRQVHLLLDTDGSVTQWGFCVDQVESTPPPCSCVGHCSCDTVCSCVGHCSCDTVCSCVGNCTCDSVHYWYPN